MVETSPDWLPPGFCQKVKYKDGRKIKYFLNSVTGAKFRSKNEVLSSVAEGSDILTSKHAHNGSRKAPSIAYSSEWLPNGWLVEEKVRESGVTKGLTYKVYTQLSSGKKFYSMAQVNRCLSVDQADSPLVRSKDVNFGITREKTKNPVSVASSSNISRRNKKGRRFFVTIAVETFPADELPPGWIKEIKTKKRGNMTRKDLFFTDPKSGYTFYSKLDALRYLKTDDISKCAIRPIKQGSDSIKSAADVKSTEQKNQVQDENVGNLFEVEKRKQTVVNPSGSSNSKRKNDASKLPSRASKKRSPDEHVVGRRRPVENSNDAAILENTTCPVKEVKRKSNSSSTKRRPASKRRTVESPPNNAAVLAGSESFPGTESGKNEEEPPLSPAEKLINVAAAPAAENPPAAVAEEHRGRRSSWLLDDFGDDWSDPLEFALKTLQGDVVVPIDCNLPIPGSLEDHFQTTTTTTTPLASRTPESEAKQNGNENKGNATVPNFSSFVNLSGKLDHDHPSNP